MGQRPTETKEQNQEARAEIVIDKLKRILKKHNEIYGALLPINSYGHLRKSYREERVSSRVKSSISLRNDLFRREGLTIPKLSLRCGRIGPFNFEFVSYIN